MNGIGQIIKSSEAAKMLGISPGTLRSWRCQGRGPRYFKEGQTVFYKISDIEYWLNERTFSNTSQHQKVGKPLVI